MREGFFFFFFSVFLCTLTQGRWERPTEEDIKTFNGIIISLKIMYLFPLLLFDLYRMKLPYALMIPIIACLSRL